MADAITQVALFGLDGPRAGEAGLCRARVGRLQSVLVSKVANGSAIVLRHHDRPLQTTPS